MVNTSLLFDKTSFVWRAYKESEQYITSQQIFGTILAKAQPGQDVAFSADLNPVMPLFESRFCEHGACMTVLVCERHKSTVTNKSDSSKSSEFAV
jgi:hypothetical protein